jgi:hypothetical protein
MNNHSRTILILLLLGISGLLLIWCLPSSLYITIEWMPILMVILSIGSIVCLLIGLILVLSGYDRTSRFLIRIFSLSAGLLSLYLAHMLSYSLKESATRSDALMAFSVTAPVGILLSIFGVGLELWIAKVLKINRWAIYRYAIRLFCFSCAFAMTSYLILDNGFQTLSQKDPLTFRRFIVYSITFSGFGLGLNPWEKYFKSKEKL